VGSRDVEGEGIERVRGAVERAGHQRVHVRLVHVGLADQAQRLAEDGQVFVQGVVFRLRLARVSRPQQRGREQREDENGGEKEEEDATAAHNTPYRNQPRGSSGRFSTRISK
jgi:hypothetical protein